MQNPTELTIAWTHGWAVSRGASRPVTIDGGVRIDFPQSGHLARYVLHTYNTQRLVQLGRELTHPGTEIKIVGSTASLRAALPDEWSMYPPNHLMTAAFVQGVVELPAPYTHKIVVDGAVTIALVLDRDGEIAARARLAPSGRYGVIDRVRTHESHQRRGLGTAIMMLLGNRALDAGLTTGVLSATIEGRALYEALGWTAHVEVAGAFRS